MSLFDGVRNLIDLPEDGPKHQIDAPGNSSKPPEETQPNPARIAPPEQTQRAVEEQRETEHRNTAPGPWLMFWVQAALCVFTAGAFGAAAWYASIARDQKDTMNGQWASMLLQWETMRDSVLESQRQTPGISKGADAAQSAAITASNGLEIAQRAYLSVGTPESPLGLFGMMKLPVENYGHIPSRWFKLTLNYRRTGNPPISPPTGRGARVMQVHMVDIFKKTVTVTEHKVIAPGPVEYSLIAVLPQLLADVDASAINGGAQMLSIDGSIEYDIGFGGKSDILKFCTVYQPTLQKWASCGGGTTEIKLTEDQAPNTPAQ